MQTPADTADRCAILKNGGVGGKTERPKGYAQEGTPIRNCRDRQVQVTLGGTESETGRHGG